MYPRWHFVLGMVFVALIWFIAPQISPIYLVLILSGSFLIDFDHYVASVIKTKKYRLKDSFEYHRKKEIQTREEIAKGIRRRDDFHLFHTIEFHILIGLLGMFWVGLFYVFIGMIFHSLLDVLYLIRRGAFHRREYFFFNWWRKRRKINNPL